MRKRKLSREKALEEYLIYRRRVRELLDMAQIARDIKMRKYEPRDLLGRGPERFSETVGDALIGLFASLIDTHPATLNVFDVWLALFLEKRGRINEGGCRDRDPGAALAVLENEFIGRDRAARARLAHHYHSGSQEQRGQPRSLEPAILFL